MPEMLAPSSVLFKKATYKLMLEAQQTRRSALDEMKKGTR
jgi:hypothetical protein